MLFSETTTPKPLVYDVFKPKRRTYLLIENLSDTTLYLKFESQTYNFTESAAIFKEYGVFEPVNVPQCAIYALVSAASDIRILERIE